MKVLCRISTTVTPAIITVFDVMELSQKGKAMMLSEIAVISFQA